MKFAFCLGAALAVAGSTGVLAEETAIQLKPGAGMEMVEGNCGACHSLDYIQMNSPIQDKEGWGKTVGKMVKTFGAPIAEADQTAIIAYLAATYSK